MLIEVFPLDGPGGTLEGNTVHIEVSSLIPILLEWFLSWRLDDIRTLVFPIEDPFGWMVLFLKGQWWKARSDLV